MSDFDYSHDYEVDGLDIGDGWSFSGFVQIDFDSETAWAIVAARGYISNDTVEAEAVWGEDARQMTLLRPALVRHIEQTYGSIEKFIYTVTPDDEPDDGNEYWVDAAREAAFEEEAA